MDLAWSGSGALDGLAQLSKSAAPEENFLNARVVRARTSFGLAVRKVVPLLPDLPLLLCRASLRDGVTTGDLMPRLLLLFWALLRVCSQLVVGRPSPLGFCVFSARNGKDTGPAQRGDS